MKLNSFIGCINIPEIGGYWKDKEWRVNHLARLQPYLMADNSSKLQLSAAADNPIHLVAQAAMDAILVIRKKPLPLKRKIEELMQRIWNVTNTPVEIKEYVPATNTDYGFGPGEAPQPTPHIVLFFPRERGYSLLHTAGFIGPAVKLNLTQQHEGAFNIVQLRVADGSVAYRLTFVEKGVVKKVRVVRK